MFHQKVLPPELNLIEADDVQPDKLQYNNEEYMALGETLVSQGVISQDQLNKGLEAQKANPGKKIGELLIELGFTTNDAVNKALGK